MNYAQRGILLGASLLALAEGAYPPWCVGSEKLPLFALWNPPVVTQLPKDQQFQGDIFDQLAMEQKTAEYLKSLSAEELQRLADAPSSLHTRLDWERLSMEWGLTALVSCAAWLACMPAKLADKPEQIAPQDAQP